MRKVKMNDYKRFWDNKNRRWVYKHRVVASKILGRPLKSNEQVHHIDENVENNSPDNLEILSVGEHLKKHNPTLTKLSNEDVDRMRELRLSGLKLSQLALIFEVHEGTVSRICALKRRI